MSHLLEKPKKYFLYVLVITLVSFAPGLLAVPTYAYNEYNCDDFSTQEEAQDEYDSSLYDDNYLDGDDDGVGCETLPSASSYEYETPDYDPPEGGAFERSTSSVDTASSASGNSLATTSGSSDSGTPWWTWAWIFIWPAWVLAAWLWEKLTK